jgi:hypothetical protein|tara:strand:- start:275 stop:532 length:258 start_codon:yes stop_codon:yes gene_type:complete
MKKKRGLVIRRETKKPCSQKEIVHDADTWLKANSADVSIPSSWPEPWQFSAHYIGVREIPSGLIRVDPPSEEDNELPNMRTPQPD